MARDADARRQQETQAKNHIRGPGIGSHEEQQTRDAVIKKDKKRTENTELKERGKPKGNEWIYPLSVHASGSAPVLEQESRETTKAGEREKVREERTK